MNIYADAALARVLIAVDRRPFDIDPALAHYARARRAAGVQLDAVVTEFKRVLGRAARTLTVRLVELYFGK
jgi:hypothetical protein